MALLPSPQDILAKVNGTASTALPSPASVLKTAQTASSPTPGSGFLTTGIIKPAVSLYKAATSALQGLGGKLASAYSNETQAFQELGGGKISLTPSDLLSGTKTVASTLGNTIGSVAQGINQGVIRIGKSIEAALPGGTQALSAPASPAEQNLEKSITGATSTPTYQDIYHSARDYALNNNASTHEASLFGGLAVVGSLFADNPLTAPEGGEAVKLTAQGIKDLAAASTDDAAKAVLKREMPALSAHQLEVLAPAFRAAPDEASVQALADGVKQAANSPVRGASAVEGELTPPPPPDQIRAAAEKVNPEPDQLRLQTAELTPGPIGSPSSALEAQQRYQDEIVQPRADMGQARIIGADDLKDYFGNDYNLARHPVYSKAANDLLFQNAKEVDNPNVIFTAGGTGAGKSEFIAKSIAPDFDGVIYDSTLLNYEGAARQIRDLRELGKDVHIYAVIRDPETAYQFTKLREAAGGHPVSEAAFIRSHSQVSDVVSRLHNDLDVPIKVLDVRNITDPEQIRNLKFSADPLAVLEDSRYSVDDVKQAIERARQREGATGGANAGDEKANLPPAGRARENPAGEAAPAGPSGPILRGDNIRQIVPGEKGPAPLSPNLLKAIGEERMPGPIADLLGTKYPFLSERTRELFAQKLAGMKRTPDIEAALRMLSSTDEALKATAPKALAVSAQKASEGGLDREVAAALTPRELDAHIAAVSKALNDPERAALAQQEYDLLWEHASQPVLNRMNEVELERSYLNDVLDSHPAEPLYSTYYKKLGRDVDDPTYALQDVMGSAQLKAKKVFTTGSGKLAKYEESARGLDTFIHELGYEDFDAAQAAVEQYKKVLDRRNALTDELHALRPRARAIRILQPFMEDVPVIQRKDVGAIDALAHPDAIRGAYKDISGFAGSFRDLARNFEHVFGEHYGAVKKAVLDPFDAAKGRYVDEVKKLGDELEAGITKPFGFKRGSKESQAIMDYGERELAKNRVVPGINFNYTSEDGLVKAFGREKADKIIEAEQWFRSEYDRLIDEANEVRGRIYPNQPSKLIPKRSDYFRHYQELGGDFKGLVNLFENPAGIDPQLAGISEFTKPSSKFLSFAQRRLGQGSERDAIGGFLDYAPAFSYMKHIDPEIGKFRFLRRRLAENAPVPGTKELVEKEGERGLEQQDGINNFLEYLDDFANDLAGKTNPVDRYLQKIVPGGRKTMKVLSWVNSRIKANQIVGNLSSSVAQAFNLPQMIASAKGYMLPGAQRSLASIFTKDPAMEASTFLKERYMHPLENRFKLDWVDHPIKAGTERATQFAAWMTQALDEASTKLGWQAHYALAQDQIAKSVDGVVRLNGVPYTDPGKLADDVVRKLVAGRGIGEVPLGQKSKLAQIGMPFQVEVANSWWAMKDMLTKSGSPARAMGTLATFLVASYLMNEAAQRIRGSRVVFDPINSVIQGTSDAINELQDDGSPMRAATIFVGRQLGEILSNVPLGQTFASAVPDTWLQGIGFPGGKQEIFGNANPGRFGSGLLALEGFADPLFKLLPPVGGAQAEKTYQGIKAMLAGHATTADGKVSFKTSQSPLSVAQAVLFGKNATPEAQKYYADQDQLFMRIYRQDYKRTELNIQAEGVWKQAQDINKSQGKDAAIQFLASSTKASPELADAVKGVATSEAQGLTGTDRLVSMLGVNNGERAKYILETVKTMDSREEQISFLQRLSDEKLASKLVAQQLVVLGLGGALHAK